MTTDNICSMCGQSAPGGFPDFEKEIRIELRPFPDGEVICLACGGGDVETRVKSILDRLKCDPDADAFVLKLSNREVARAINKSFADRGLDLQSLSDKDLANAFQMAVDGLSTLDGNHEMAYVLDSWEAARRPLCSEEARVKSILTRMDCDPDGEVYVLVNQDVATVVSEKLEEDGIDLESLSDDELSRIFHAAIDGVQDGSIDWISPMQDGINEVREWRDPNDADDEGPLTEQYENSSRLHDDDWLEAAYEERWDE